MNSNYLLQIEELEQEFTQELKGYGSLSIHLAGDSVDDKDYLGYDIRPEDIEALYFEGIGTPRWESIEADSVEQQLEIYNRSMKEQMLNYPLIGRVTDTDQRVEYKPDELLQLRAECETVLETTADPKAVRALQKFAIACHKASKQQKSLLLIPG
jgi:hypothetical protein